MRIQLRAADMRRAPATFGLALITVFLFLSIQYSTQASKPLQSWPRSHHPPKSKAFPRKVWQTWQGSKILEDEPLRLARTWVEMNPGYGYELLTDETARDYIELRFPERPDVLEIWDRIADYILRADLVRYLTMLGDGGIYTDIDTDCSKPIETWLSEEQRAAADLVVGIEYDTRHEERRKDMDASVQLASWTIMAKPGSPHMQYVVDRVLDNLRIAINEEGKITASNATDVLALTGPRRFTRALLESMTTQLGAPIGAQNLTLLETPKLLGSVLVMPISSFASGQDHSGSKPWGNEQQLLSHHWTGFRTWKLDYPDR